MMPVPDHTDAFIASLVSDLTPVRRITASSGLLLAGSAALLAVLVVTLAFGIRPELLGGHVDPVFLLSVGLFLMLGCASVWSVIQMGRPYVGNHQSGWLWATAMAALLPASALISAGASMANGASTPVDGEGWRCLAGGVTLGLGMAALLTLWLRQAAPTALARAGLLTGLAAGSTGIFAFALHCPHNDLGHIGIWHGLAVAVSALAGLWSVPRAIRW